MSDQVEGGSAFRILTLIDEHTRECQATHVAWSIRATDVRGVLESAMRRHGMSDHIRSDNGPEFIAYAIQGLDAALTDQDERHQAGFTLGERIHRIVPR